MFKKMAVIVLGLCFCDLVAGKKTLEQREENLANLVNAIDRVDLSEVSALYFSKKFYPYDLHEARQHASDAICTLEKDIDHRYQLLRYHSSWGRGYARDRIKHRNKLLNDARAIKLVLEQKK